MPLLRDQRVIGIGANLEHVVEALERPEPVHVEFAPTHAELPEFGHRKVSLPVQRESAVFQQQFMHGGETVVVEGFHIQAAHFCTQSARQGSNVQAGGLRNGAHAAPPTSIGLERNAAASLSELGQPKDYRRVTTI